jgi:hypothetical protein
MIKVIYLAYIRLTTKTRRDWYIDTLLSRNIQVEYWDVVSLVRKNYTEISEIDADYKKIFHDYAQLRQEIKIQNPEKTIYVMLVGYEWRTIKLYRELSKFFGRMVFFSWGATPINHDGFWSRIKRKINDPKKLLLGVRNRLWCTLNREFGLVAPYDIIFLVGEKPQPDRKLAKTVISINLCDFDNYKRLLLLDVPSSDPRYAVFLDINLPYQSDLGILCFQKIDAQRYFDSLAHFFQKIEQQFNLIVIIAAHPKARYTAEAFGGRRIVYNDTPQLVRGATLILSHHSTSVSYAVLNRKPIIFFYNSEMAKIYTDTVVRYIEEIAQYLSAPCLNCDLLSDEELLNFPEINLAKYEEYKYNFLVTRESENSYNEEIFLKELTDLVGEILENVGDVHV